MKLSRKIFSLILMSTIILSLCIFNAAAVTYVIDEDFEDASYALTWNVAAGTQNLATTGFGNQTNYYSNSSNSDSGSRGAYSNITAQTGLVAVDLDIKMDSGNNSSSGFSLLSATNSTNSIPESNRILQITQTSYAGAYTLNGATIILPRNTATTIHNHEKNYGSTGWLHLTAIMDFSAKKVAVKISKEIGGGGEVLYDQSIDFYDAAPTQFSSVHSLAGRGLGVNCYDNIKISQTAIPVISTSVERLELDLNGVSAQTFSASAADWEIDSAVTSAPDDITASVSGNNITVTGINMNTNETVTITMKNINDPRLKYTKVIPVDVINSGVVLVAGSVAIDGSDIIQKISGQAIEKNYTGMVISTKGINMEDEAITWSVDHNPTGVSISQSGVLTILDIAAGDSTITVRATTQNNAFGTFDVTIRDFSYPKTYNIVGNTAIKAGKSATYSITNVKDQYGQELNAQDYTFTLSTTSDLISFSGLTATAKNSFVSETGIESVEITATCGGETQTKTISVYNIYYYEPAVDYINDHSTYRLGVIGGENVLLWPATAAASTTHTFTLPDTIPLVAGEAFSIKWKQAYVKQGVYSQQRYLDFQDSNNTTLFKKIGYINEKVGYNSYKDGNGYVFEENSALSASLDPISTETKANWVDFEVIIKTNSQGKSAAYTIVNGNISTAVDVSGTNLSKFSLFGEKVAPDDRLLGMKDIKIAPATVKDVEIDGKDYITRISGTNAARQYTASAFGDNGTAVFHWSLKEAYSGVTIDQTGLLSVTPDAIASNVTIVCENADDASKFDEKVITINDFANIESFDIVGSYIIIRGETAEYSIANIKDQYGDIITMPASYSLSSGNEAYAAISQNTITAINNGDITLRVSLGNPGMKKELTKNIKIVTFSETQNINGASAASFDVTKLANPNTNTDYTVTIVSESSENVKVAINGNQIYSGKKSSADAKLEIVTVVPAVAGELNFTFTGNVKTVEVSPNYKLDLGTETGTEGYVGVSGSTIFDGALGYGFSAPTGNLTNSGLSGVASSYVNISGKSFDISLPDGYYDFIFTKGTTTRASIYVNDTPAGMNIDQNGQGSSISGRTVYEAKYIKVSGGLAKITMSNDFGLAGVEIRKASSLKTRPVTIFIAGDSTVCEYYNNYRDDTAIAAGTLQTGWGQLLHRYLNEDMRIFNIAASGTYAKNWYTSGFSAVRENAQPGDYIFIQFGINDRTYSSISEMQEYLGIMIDECVASGVIPVILNPQHSTKFWGSDGNWTNPNGSGNAGFFAGVKALANEKNALFIDLSALSSVAFGKVGKVYCDDYYFLTRTTANDNLHLSYAGAKKVAELVVNNIAEQKEAGIQDAYGKTFANIKLNPVTTYDFSYQNSSDETVTEAITAISYKQNGSLFSDLVAFTPNVSVVNNTLYVQQAIKNNSNLLKDAAILLSVYNEGKLVSITTKELKLTPSTMTTAAIEAQLPEGAAYKIMLWDTFGSLSPIALAN